MQVQTLSGGFQNPPEQSAHVFRAIMQAMARPGRIYDVSGATPPAPLSIAAGCTLLTLCDADTPLHLAGGADTEEVRTWLAFHTGAPLVGPKDCLFALGRWDALTPLSRYPIGTPEYPDRAATLIVESGPLSASGATLRGPGIKNQASLSLPEREAFQRNHALLPLGLDFIFTHASQLAALPRSVEVC